MFSWMSALTLPLSTATQPSWPRTVDPSMTTLLLFGDCEARRAPAGSAASTPIDAHIPYG